MKVPLSILVVFLSAGLAVAGFFAVQTWRMSEDIATIKADVSALKSQRSSIAQTP